MKHAIAPCQPGGGPTSAKGVVVFTIQAIRMLVRRDRRRAIRQEPRDATDSFGGLRAILDTLRLLDLRPRVFPAT
jgi:hypothetical protein